MNAIEGAVDGGELDEHVPVTEHVIEVSVVVPAYNQSGKLRSLLDSLEKMEESPRYEVVVVDDCSPDDTQAVVQEWRRRHPGFPLEYLRLETNAGPAAARNAGTQTARGAVVAYTDSDCRVDSQWLRNLVRGLDRRRSLVGVGGSVRPVNPKGFFSQYNTVNHILEPFQGLIYLVTANCCYYRDCVLAVGGFDADVRKPGGEDVALCIKMTRQGWRFAFDADAVVYHDYRESLRDFFQTWKNYALGCGYVTGKYLATHEDDIWNANTIHPPVPTPRLIRYVLGVEYDLCRVHHVPRVRTALFLLLRFAQMFVHFEYFRQGEAVFLGRGSLLSRARTFLLGLVGIESRDRGRKRK